MVAEEDDFRSALACTLRDDGYNVVDVPNCSALPPPARLREPVALLIDQSRSLEDAFEAARRFHRLHPGAPILLLASFVTDHLEARVRQQAYLTLLRKPLDYGLLLDRIEERHHGPRELHS